MLAVSQHVQRQNAVNIYLLLYTSLEQSKRKGASIYIPELKASYIHLRHCRIKDRVEEMRK